MEYSSAPLQRAMTTVSPLSIRSRPCQTALHALGGVGGSGGSDGMPVLCGPQPTAATVSKRLAAQDIEFIESPLRNFFTRIKNRRENRNVFRAADQSSVGRGAGKNVEAGVIEDGGQ